MTYLHIVCMAGNCQKLLADSGEYNILMAVGKRISCFCWENGGNFMHLLQDKLAQKIWLENQYGGYLTQIKVEAMMIDCNLKYRKGKTYNDLVIAIGNGYKNSLGKSKVIREQLAEEIDKVLIRKRWDF